MSCHAPAIQERISSSDGFFLRPLVVNSWVPSAIHSIHLFLTPSLNGLFKETSSGCKIEVNPPGITAKFVFSCVNAVFTLCHVGFKRVTNKEAPSPQATSPRMPNFLDQCFHSFTVHPTFLLSGDYNSVLVGNLWESFSFEDYHRSPFASIASTGQRDCNVVLFITRRTNLDRLLSRAVDGSIWRHVKC